MFDLLFGNKKISSLSQLKDNFDLESVKLYYLGGSLMSWLDNCGENEIAEKLRAVDTSKDIDTQLAVIFGQPAPIKVDIQKALAVSNAKNALSSFLFSENPLSYAVAANNSSFLSQASQQISSFDMGISSFSAANGSFANIGGSFEYRINSFGYSTGSFEYLTGSFSIGISSFAYKTGSFGYEYEYEFESGSFRNTANSFNFEQSSFYSNINSFNFENTSFTLNTSSYVLGSFLSNFASSSFSPSSFNSSFYADSFAASCDKTNYSSYSEGDKAEVKPVEEIPAKTPEEKVCENLTFSPLNQFGYGIHLI